jgi:Ca2+-binding EF-hand superfamily protein
MHQKTSTSIRRNWKKTKNPGGVAVSTCLHNESRCKDLLLARTLCNRDDHYFAIFCVLYQTIFFWTLIARNISRFLDRNGLLSAQWDQSSPVEVSEASARAHAQFSEEQDKQIEAAFRLFDTDGSGVLEEQEMRSALFALGYLTGPQSGRTGMEWSRPQDANGVNLEQFKEILRGSQQRKSHLEEIRKTFFAIVDRGGPDTGDAQSPGAEELLRRKVNIHNLRQACQRFEVRLSEDELLHIIKETDRDGSEDVDWEEYAHILKHSCWF